MKYEVRFLTPAFLGNAEQSGQWRTPPFKALLRQWWRVVWATRHGFPADIEAMRRDEGRLFGNAWLDGDFRKSAVRLRLDKWAEGLETQDRWGRQEADRASKVHHPEVHQPVGPLLYMGYGPLHDKKAPRQGGQGHEYPTVLKSKAAIQAGESATLSLAAPSSAIDGLEAALALMNAYGTLGGRSRNGWGSLAIEPLEGVPSPQPDRLISGQGDRDEACGQRVVRPFRPWRDALELDWPHVIGADEIGSLVWRTAQSYDDWKALMRDLAVLKIGLRTMFVFPKPPHQRPLDRHWLSYPVTRHEVRQWSKKLRLPNSLRFKVRPDRADPSRLRGIIFHVPCLPPGDFKPDAQQIQKVWETTHRLLDELTSASSGRRYQMIRDNTRRGELKQSLDTLVLERIPE